MADVAPQPVRNEAIEGIEVQVKKDKLLDEANRPTFQDNQGERFFWYSFSLLVGVTGIVLAALIGAGILHLGDYSNGADVPTWHLVVRWVVFPIMLGLSILVSVASVVLIVRECVTLRRARYESISEQSGQSAERYSKLGSDFEVL